MQFLIIAYDAEDKDAPKRRAAAREAHIATIAKYKKSGNMKMGVAILDDDGNPVGSCIVCEFPSVEALDGWLEEEPYIKQKVWDEVGVSECKIGPSFADQ
jgi:uncharacterized protein